MDGIKYPDLMVDVETTGLDPANCAIIQIGAVPFNYQTGEIDSANMYCRSMTMPKNKFWTSGTDKFWLQDNREVYLKIMETAQDPRAVLLDFHSYVLARGDVGMWAKGFFDWQMIEQHYIGLNMDTPFNFRQAKDMRSFICGLRGETTYYDEEVEKVGDAHNALHDCLTQLKILFKAKEKNKRCLCD
jgi:3' exoribonuclease, RNase T-like